jgi:MoaA/NifB/PqqE/SkfB family radical SAM enzyme
MTRREAEGYIDEAASIPSMRWVSFTGGEPFLLPELIRALIPYAADRGLRTECVTNCAWATSREKAAEELEGLAGLGLDALNVSADDFHQAQIPFERVRSCHDAAKEIGLKTVIMCTTSRSSRLRLIEIARLLGGGIYVLGGDRPERFSAIGVESAFTPVGRAASLPVDERITGGSTIEGPCEAVLRDIGVRPRGDVMPCCSAASRLEALRVGNISNGGLSELLETAWDQPVFNILATEGPVGLREGKNARDGSYVNRCHLCHELLKRG